MSAVVKTNAQWWVLIPLSLSGFSQRQQSRGHIATALSADWTGRRSAAPARRARRGFLSTWQHPAAVSAPRTGAAGSGNLKGKSSRAILTEGSSVSP